MGMEGPGGGAAIVLGSADGFVVKYISANVAAITSGKIEANGKEYTLAADTTHAMTSLLSAFEIYNIYINDATSAPPAANFYHSAVAPVWSDSKRGWYNGNDRRIGVLVSTIGATTLIRCGVQEISSRVISLEVGETDLPALATAMSPTGGYQIPNTNESSAVVPVGAIEIIFQMANSAAGLNVGLFCTTLEGSTSFVRWSIQAYEDVIAQGKINLDASRKLRIGGIPGNDNNLGLRCLGFKYQR